MNRIKRTIEKKKEKIKDRRERDNNKENLEKASSQENGPHLLPRIPYSVTRHISFVVSPRSERIDQDSTRIEANFAESGHSLRKEKRDEVTWPRERAPPTLSTGGRGRRKSARGSIPPPLFCNHPRLAAVCRRQCIWPGHCPAPKRSIVGLNHRRPGLGIFRDGRWSVAIIVGQARVRFRRGVDTLENLEHFEFLCLPCLPSGGGWHLNYWL